METRESVVSEPKKSRQSRGAGKREELRGSEQSSSFLSTEGREIARRQAGGRFSNFLSVDVVVDEGPAAAGRQEHLLPSRDLAVRVRRHFPTAANKAAERPSLYRRFGASLRENSLSHDRSRRRLRTTCGTAASSTRPWRRLRG